MDLKTKHEKLLYPVVRVFGKKGAGSGTVIYSEEDVKNKGEYLTFVLTNHHVVADLINLKDAWHSVLKKTKKQEVIDKAKVEIFSYHSMSTIDSSNRYSAEIVAYDDHHDLAILRLETPRRVEFVAPILPEEMIKNGVQFIHLATGLIVGYPPCPYIHTFKDFLEKRYDVKVVIGTHPIPQKYLDMHRHLKTWDNPVWKPLLESTMSDEKTRIAYN